MEFSLVLETVSTLPQSDYYTATFNTLGAIAPPSRSSQRPAVNNVFTPPLTHRGALLSTLLHAILPPTFHLLNVLLQIANTLGFS
jgi:hypothetical protein